MIRLVLRTNAIVNVAAAAILGAATWDELYARLTLPAPEDAFSAQLAGIFVLALGYLLWIAPRDVRLTRAVAAAAALANTLVAVFILSWLLDVRFDMSGHHAEFLAVAAAVAAILGAGEGVIASRNIAMLLPPD